MRSHAASSGEWAEVDDQMIEEPAGLLLHDHVGRVLEPDELLVGRVNVLKPLRCQRMRCGVIVPTDEQEDRALEYRVRLEMQGRYRRQEMGQRVEAAGIDRRQLCVTVVRRQGPRVSIIREIRATVRETAIEIEPFALDANAVHRQRT